MKVSMRNFWFEPFFKKNYCTEGVWILNKKVMSESYKTRWDSEYVKRDLALLDWI